MKSHRGQEKRMFQEDSDQKQFMQLRSIRTEKYLLDMAKWWSIVALRKQGSQTGMDWVKNGKK